jgi:hypothetical protein
MWFSISIMILCVVFLTLFGLGLWRAVWVEREQNRLAVQSRIENAKAEALYDKLWKEEEQLLLRKYTSGYILDFIADDRANLCGARSKQVNAVVRVPRMQRDVYNWCRSNIRGKWEMIPYMEGRSVSHQLWFEDPNDAMYFKMRWY